MERIAGRRNPLCVHFKKLGIDKAYRESCREFLCDGLKLLEDAENAGAEIVSVLTSSHLPFPLPVDTRVYMTDSGIINSISPLKNAQKVLFSCRMPRFTERDIIAGVLLDGVQDPGNVGTIVRTANAFGIKDVLLTGSCADIYNPKTIRATMGAVFRQNIRYMTFSELCLLKDKGIRFVGASLSDNSKDFRDISLRDCVIAIGSEGRGLSEQILTLCEEKVMIPICPMSDSLNAAVAAAILLWSTK